MYSYPNAHIYVYVHIFDLISSWYDPFSTTVDYHLTLLLYFHTVTYVLIIFLSLLTSYLLLLHSFTPIPLHLFFHVVL